jgi:uncharacterized protein YecE (DUF72 family)
MPDDNTVKQISNSRAGSEQALIDWHLGTMGFSYKDWNGVFYPSGSPARDYLAHYSQVFDAVELDSTFYGTPRPEYVSRWASVTPDNFSISVKTPREITHDLRLVDATEPMNKFLETMQLLGDKLGVVLIQLPPDMTFSNIRKLAVFIRQLPAGFRYAIEFRDSSWHSAATSQLLENHGICWVSTDYIHLPRTVYVTAKFIYIRWIGRHGQYEVKDHEREDMTARLNWWWGDIHSRLNGTRAVYGFFNNDFAGHAPATCNRFKEIVGLPTRPLQPPQQQRLL